MEEDPEETSEATWKWLAGYVVAVVCVVGAVVVITTGSRRLGMVAADRGDVRLM